MAGLREMARAAEAIVLRRRVRRIGRTVVGRKRRVSCSMGLGLREVLLRGRVVRIAGEGRGCGGLLRRRRALICGRSRRGRGLGRSERLLRS